MVISFISFISFLQIFTGKGLLEQKRWPTLQKTHRTEEQEILLPHLSGRHPEYWVVPIALLFLFLRKRPPDLVRLHIPDLPKVLRNKVMGARQGFWGVCLKGKTFHWVFDARPFFFLYQTCTTSQEALWWVNFQSCVTAPSCNPLWIRLAWLPLGQFEKRWERSTSYETRFWRYEKLIVFF